MEEKKTFRRNVYEFLDDVIGDQQRINLIGVLVIIFNYFQIFVAQLIPYVFGTKEKTWIHTLVANIIFFSTSLEVVFSNIYVIYILFYF